MLSYLFLLPLVRLRKSDWDSADSYTIERREVPYTEMYGRASDIVPSREGIFAGVDGL